MTAQLSLLRGAVAWEAEGLQRWGTDPDPTLIGGVTLCDSCAGYRLSFLIET